MSLADLFDLNDQIYYVGAALTGGSLSSSTGAPQGALFYSVNAVDPDWATRAFTLPLPPVTPRFSLNVTKFRNFVFESDCMDPKDQLNEWLKLSTLVPIKRITFSGGKSYHAVISCLDDLGFEPHTAEGVSSYKQAWKGLKGFIEHNSVLRLDDSTKDPSRLTRLPNASRAGVVQSAIEFNARYISSAEIMKIMASHAPVQVRSATPVTGPQLSTNSLQAALKTSNNHKSLAFKVFEAQTWAQPVNMYPALFRLTLWALDSLNPSGAAWTSLLEQQVFPKIRATGYNRNLLLPVQNAYAYKGKQYP